MTTACLWAIVEPNIDADEASTGDLRSRCFRAPARWKRPTLFRSQQQKTPPERGFPEAAGQGFEPQLPDPEMAPALRPAETGRDKTAPLRDFDESH